MTDQSSSEVESGRERVASEQAERGPIAFDLACLGCGYNLRALNADADCPECGEPVQRTLDGFRTAWTSEQARRWAGACRLVGISGILTAIMPLVVLLEAFGILRFLTYYIEGIISGVAFSMVIVAEHVLWAIGLWRLSSGHPGVKEAGDDAVRTMQIAGLTNAACAVTAVVLVLGAFGLNRVLGPAEEKMLMIWLGMVILLGLICRGASAWGLSRLLRRTLGAGGYLWKRRHVIATSIAVGVLVAVQLLATLMLTIDGLTDSDDMMAPAAVIGIPSILALPFIAIWGAVSVFRAGVAFRDRLPDGG